MLFRMSSGVLVQMKGCLRWFEALMKARILATRWGTEGKAPRRMACRSMMANQTSTRFSQDPEVGVKWTRKERRFRSMQMTGSRLGERSKDRSNHERRRTTAGCSLLDLRNYGPFDAGSLRGSSAPTATDPRSSVSFPTTSTSS